MKTLPITASKEEIRELVIEWNELLAQEKYKEAFEMFPAENRLESDTQPDSLMNWTGRRNYWNQQYILMAVRAIHGKKRKENLAPLIIK